MAQTANLRHTAAEIDDKLDQAHEHDNRDVLDELTPADLERLRNSEGGVGDALNLPLGQDLTVDGVLFSADTSVWDALNRIHNPVIPPTYLSPTLTLAGTTPLAREIGELVTVTLTPNFTQRNGGAATQYRLSRNGTNILTQATVSAHTDTEFQLTENTTYQAQVDFSQGAILNDSAGNPHPHGRIEAGTITSGNVQYLPRRVAFFGHGTTTVAPEISDDIRSLQSSFLHPQNNTTMVVDVPEGSHFVCFAYPANLRPITSIIQAGLNMDVKDGFTETVIEVDGANGFDAIDYRVYYTITEFPFGALTRYTATI